MFQREFSARVTEINGNRVRLDRTCFYIQGAGQSGDCGEIDGQRVIDTQKGGWHLIQNPPSFIVGQEVNCRIDWNRRHRTMRLHSASHIVEHYIYQEIGKTNINKTNVNHKKDFTDYRMSLPSQEVQQRIIELANDFINLDNEISIELDKEGIFHWYSGEIHMQCSGMHVRNTQEISRIKISFEQKEKGITRVIITLA